MRAWFCRLFVGMIFSIGTTANAAIVFSPDSCSAAEAANWTATSTAPNAVLTTNCTFNVELSSLDAAPPDDDQNWQGFNRQLPAGMTGVTINHRLGQVTAGLFASVGASYNARLIYGSGAFGFWNGTEYEYSVLGDRCVVDDWCTFGLRFGGVSVLEYLINDEVLGQVNVASNVISEIALMGYNPFGAPIISNRVATPMALVPDTISLSWSGLEATGPDRNQVPEPMSWALVMVALTGLTLTYRRKKPALAHRR